MLYINLRKANNTVHTFEQLWWIYTICICYMHIYHYMLICMYIFLSICLSIYGERETWEAIQIYSQWAYGDFFPFHLSIFSKISTMNMFNICKNNESIFCLSLRTPHFEFQCQWNQDQSHFPSGLTSPRTQAVTLSTLRGSTNLLRVGTEVSLEFSLKSSFRLAK